MCNLAVEDSDWIAADPWESLQPWFVDFPQVCSHVLSSLEFTEGIPRDRIRVFYLCGADLALKCGLNRRGLEKVYYYYPKFFILYLICNIVIDWRSGCGKTWGAK
jgi:hypothetical protein